MVQVPCVSAGADGWLLVSLSWGGTCYGLSELSLKLVDSVMTAKIGQAKSAGGETCAYYARQYSVALLLHVAVSLLEVVFFLCWH